jgi:hypothetical protein
VHNQHRQGDQRKLLLQPFVGAHHLCDGLRRLNLMRDQRVVVHGFDDLDGFTPEAATEKETSLSTPPDWMWPSWRNWVPRNQLAVRPFTERT